MVETVLDKFDTDAILSRHVPETFPKRVHPVTPRKADVFAEAVDDFPRLDSSYVGGTQRKRLFREEDEVFGVREHFRIRLREESKSFIDLRGNRYSGGFSRLLLFHFEILLRNVENAVQVFHLEPEKVARPKR